MSAGSKKFKDLPLDSPDLELVKLRDSIREENHWLQKAKLITEFHRREVELRPNIRGFKWKLSDTAQALGYSNGYVSESIQITEFLEKSEHAVNWSRVTRELIIAMVKGKL